MTATAATEIISTKINPNVVPHLHIWEWQIPLYLFLGGMAGGLLVITSIMIVLLRQTDPRTSKRMVSRPLQRFRRSGASWLRCCLQSP